MSWKQHIKGVLIAFFIAVVGMFALMFLMPEELVVKESRVVNKSVDSVFAYIKQPSNLPSWKKDMEGLPVEVLDSNAGLQYKGFDDKIHQFKYKEATRAKGVEISYIRDGEKTAVFTIECEGDSSEAIINVLEQWNLGYNPLKRLTAKLTSSSFEDQLKQELKVLKVNIEGE